MEILPLDPLDTFVSFRQWLEWVSKRVRGTIFGGVPANSALWLVEDEQEEDGGSADGDDRDETREDRVAHDTPVSFAPKSTASAWARSGTEDEGSENNPADNAGRTALGLPSRGGGVQSEVEAVRAKVVNGENAEAELRRRLLAAMGKSNGKRGGRL